MKFWQLVLVLPCLASATTYNNGVPRVTGEQEAMAREAFREFINNNVNEEGVRFMIPALVRLAFHDCAGGCDGCLGAQNPFNGGPNGLPGQVELIDTLYLNETFDFPSVMSRADFWALGSIVAVEEAVRINNDIFCEGRWDGCLMPEVHINFMYGRKDCPTSPFYDTDPDTPELPSGLENLALVLDYFERMFDFDEFETVAAMGAHSLGKASPMTSPFNGKWERGNQDGLNTNYYKRMTKDKQWEQIDVTADSLVPLPPGRDIWQWNGTANNGNPVLFYLNTDICLFKDIDIPDLGATAQSTCTYNDCPLSNTAELVELFAKDKMAFAEAFGHTMQRIIENGYVLRLPI